MKRLLSLVVLGCLCSAGVARADTVSYTYDKEGRLTQATYGNGTVIAYSYDSAGNRTSVVVTCGSSASC